MAVDVAAAGPATMRYTVDSWDPGYGTSFEADEELRESTARIVAGVEVPEERWRPIPVSPAVAAPAALLFVDGVRRIDARVWIDGGPDGSGDGNGSGDALASAGIGASYAAGVVCCCGSSA